MEQQTQTLNYSHLHQMRGLFSQESRHLANSIWDLAHGPNSCRKVCQIPLKEHCTDSRTGSNFRMVGLQNLLGFQAGSDGFQKVFTEDSLQPAIMWKSKLAFHMTSLGKGSSMISFQCPGVCQSLNVSRGPTILSNLNAHLDLVLGSAPGLSHALCSASNLEQPPRQGLAVAAFITACFTGCGMLSINGFGL